MSDLTAMAESIGKVSSHNLMIQRVVDQQTCRPKTFHSSTIHREVKEMKMISMMKRLRRRTLPTNCKNILNRAQNS